MNKFRKKIIFLTTGRSDYDLIRPLLLNKIKNHESLLLCTGSHLQKSFGNTYKTILSE